MTPIHLRLAPPLWEILDPPLQSCQKRTSASLPALNFGFTAGYRTCVENLERKISCIDGISVYLGNGLTFVTYGRKNIKKIQIILHTPFSAPNIEQVSETCFLNSKVITLKFKFCLQSGTYSVSDLRRRVPYSSTPGPKFLYFYAVFGKNWSNSKLASSLGIGTPSCQSWIYH